MYYIIYSSSAVAPFSVTDLEELLTHSRENNKRREITGLLYYFHNSFIQLIEGEEAVVKDLYQTLVKDTRHQFVKILREDSIQQRFFPDWTMGYKVLDAAELNDTQLVDGVVPSEALLRLFQISGNKA